MCPLSWKKEINKKTKENINKKEGERGCQNVYMIYILASTCTSSQKKDWKEYQEQKSKTKKCYPFVDLIIYINQNHIDQAVCVFPKKKFRKKKTEYPWKKVVYICKIHY